jgi:D-glycero-alpha-D-manno-heptose-7-phosphate kinase
MFFTGLSRISSEVAKVKIANLKQRHRQLSRMREMVDEAADVLCDGRTSLHQLGELLHESWRLKRELADNVSNSVIDEIYSEAMAAGASGGKLLGAGGGGFMAFIVRPERRTEVIKRLQGLVPVDVGIDFGGSKIIVYEPSMEPVAARADLVPSFPAYATHGEHSLTMIR